MPSRSPLSMPLFAALLTAAVSVRAEDPFLGIIKEIKCVNCKPGWVTLVINDPIETVDFELYLKDVDYNKIITPLPGKSIHDRNGECFYWMEKPKAAKPKDKDARTGSANPAGALGASDPKSKAAGKTAAGKPAAEPAPESSAAAAAEPAFDLPPPSAEAQGTPSSCIRFYRKMN